MQRGSPSYVYSLLLGAQTPFEHGTQADKFIYEAELRTGMGAHFRYAEHLSAALGEFLAQVPEARNGSWRVRPSPSEPAHGRVSGDIRLCRYLAEFKLVHPVHVRLPNPAIQYPVRTGLG